MLIATDDHEGHDAGVARCQQLEQGHVLVVRAALDTFEQEVQFLLGLGDALAGAHKNIAYRPDRDRVIGVAIKRGDDAPRRRDALRTALRAYARWARRLVTELLPPYADALRVDYTSFRPIEEEARALPARQRNDRLHVDAFPSRPTNGDRILRVFTNIHPTRPRRWISTAGFSTLLDRFAAAPALRLHARPTAWHRTQRHLRRSGRALGIPLPVPSPYDEIMLRFHDFLKLNHAFQTHCEKEVWDFPPRSTWIVFTDMVPHAALSGQYALEQTFIVAHRAMLLPEHSPLRLLEHRCGKVLTAT